VCLAWPTSGSCASIHTGCTGCSRLLLFFAFFQGSSSLLHISYTVLLETLEKFCYHIGLSSYPSSPVRDEPRRPEAVAGCRISKCRKADQFQIASISLRKAFFLLQPPWATKTDSLRIQHSVSEEIFLSSSASRPSSAAQQVLRTGLGLSVVANPVQRSRLLARQWQPRSITPLPVLSARCDTGCGPHDARRPHSFDKSKGPSGSTCDRGNHFRPLNPWCAGS